MRRELPTIVLGCTHVGLTSLSLLFHLAVRPALLTLYEHENAMNSGAAFALSSWLLPSAIATGIVIASVAFFQRQRRARLRFLAIGTAVNASAFIGVASAAYLPLLL